MFSFFKKLFRKGEGTVHFDYEEKKYPFGVLVLIFVMTVFILMLGERALDDVSQGVPRIPRPEYWNLPAAQKAQEYHRDYIRPLQMFEQEQRRFEDVSGELKLREAEYARLLKEAEAERKPMQREYERKNRWRQLKVFIWEAIFWVPFFALSLWWHTRSKRTASKWEIISLSVLITASILSLQSIFVLLWSWIPRAFLEWLWELLSATMITRIIGYYLMIGIAIVLFGSLIVFIHRRMTDPVRWGKRKIRQGHCPACSYPLSLSENYCGGCGKELKKNCPSCQKPGYTWQAACVYCGAKEG